MASFRCHDPWTGGTESFCGGKICYFSGDCDPGEQCVDTHTVGLPLGASCSPDGGRCISRAIAETVFGYAPNEFHEACATGCLPGQPCEAGWRPGGVYAVERIVGTCGSCDNGICEIDEGETTANCPADCACGDGQCDTSEFGTCADCATCGNALCDPLETPKLCPADCAVTCGDGSCASEEAATCLQDCACPSSVNHSDLPVACGDGICQRFGDIPEDCDNCRPDCEEDTDSDGDGSKDGCDGCPNDPKKTAPGSCGCHVVDTDTDADGLADCVDACPFDPLNDADGDAVCAGADLCLGTKIPEAVPTAELRFNHWALVDADGTFDTKRAGRGSGSGVGFTTVDTAGCSCEQIIAVLGLGIGQREYGCSTSVMQAWIAQVQP